jgi:hypothetical protein
MKRDNQHMNIMNNNNENTKIYLLNEMSFNYV